MPTPRPSRRRPWLFLGLYSISVVVLAFFARQVPGPLDIDGTYYLLVARNLAQGRGLVVDAVWHFFQPATAWPQPAGDLWMPLTSLLLAPALLLGRGFRYAQAAQVLLAALLPPLAFRIAREEGAPLPWAGLAALGTLFAGTVTPHWVDTDCYTAYALAGAAALYSMGRARDNPRWLVAAGLLGGLAAITRNDGVLLLLVLWLVALLFAHRRRVPEGAASPTAGRDVEPAAMSQRLSWRHLLLGTGFFLLPVLLWAGRNLLVFGRPSAVPLSFLLTLRNYDQLFAYQPRPDWAGFWSQGWGTFLSLRGSALSASLVVFAGDFQAWGLLPLLGIAVGLRRRPALWPAFLYLALLFLVLVLAFPLLVLHGTWSRSLSAFLPAGYAGVALGLYRLVERLRQWRPALPPRLLHGSLLAVAAVLVVGVGLVAASAQLQGARAHPATWEQVGAWVRQNTAPEEVVMAKDPMAVLLYGQRRAIGIPYEEPPRLWEVAQQYGVTTLVLVDDRGLTATLRDLYDGGAARRPLTLLWKDGDIQAYGLDLAP